MGRGFEGWVRLVWGGNGVGMVLGGMITKEGNFSRYIFMLGSEDI